MEQINTNTPVITEVPWTIQLFKLVDDGRVHLDTVNRKTVKKSISKDSYVYYKWMNGVCQSTGTDTKPLNKT